MNVEKSDTCETVHFDTVSEDAGHLQNKVSVCDPRDTRLTHEDSRKVLAQMIKAYEKAPEPCKGSLGLSLRKALRAVNAEDRT